jgi:ankyrin repeat protein
MKILSILSFLIPMITYTADDSFSQSMQNHFKDNPRGVIVCLKSAHKEAGRSVLEYADELEEHLKVDLNCQDNEGNTPLMLAIKDENLHPIAKRLIENNHVKLNITNNNQETAFEIAIKENADGLVRLMAKIRFADLDILRNRGHKLDFILRRRKLGLRSSTKRYISEKINNTFIHSEI